MQLGKHGAQGVEVQEYSTEEQIGKGKGNRKQDSNPVIGYAQPLGNNPQWIIWFNKNGDALLYTSREPSGAVTGDPIRLSAKRGAETQVTERTKNIRVLTQVFKQKSATSIDFNLGNNKSWHNAGECEEEAADDRNMGRGY
jgi:hypothetical protein